MTASNGTRISVEDASLSTATVEIQTITVRGRKVTQALFKQFQKESIFNDDLSLNGVPWGWVSYFWGLDATLASADAINLVWQKGSELRRCVLDPEPFKNQRYLNGVRLFLGGDVRGRIDTILDRSPGTWSSDYYGSQRVRSAEEVIMTALGVGHAYSSPELDAENYRDPMPREEAILSLEEDICCEAEKLEKSARLANRRNEIIATLREKPQLFIAM